MQVFYLLLLVNSCFGHPDGAPAEACVSLVPGHGNHGPQRSTPPYKIQVVVQKIKTGNRLFLQGLNSAFNDERADAILHIEWYDGLHRFHYSGKGHQDQ